MNIYMKKTTNRPLPVFQDDSVVENDIVGVKFSFSIKKKRGQLLI